MTTHATPHRARTDFRNEDEHPVSHRMEPVIVMDDQDAARNEVIEAARRFMEFFDRAMNFVYGADTEAHRLMRMDCLLLATNRYKILGLDSAALVAKKHCVKEQSINSLVKRLQDDTGLPPAQGQNTREQRGHKSKSFKKNLT